tara:strand:+ start:3158 stop:3706 length:549 start_codon:yes stop_codon:yes gene_type:complete
MYVLAPNQQVETFPYSIGQLRKDNPQVSFPKNPPDATLAQFDVFPVTALPSDYDHETQVTTGTTCAFNATLSRWETSWTVRDLTAQELLARAVEVQRQIVTQVQDRLDAFARTRNYDGIMSACTYTTSSIPMFQAEGVYCVGARDTTWATCYDILGDVQAGTRPVPSGYGDIESELPALVWP